MISGLSEMSETILRRKITIKGLVQGVGFRPFVYHLAQDLGLSGSIVNSSQGVLVEVQGGATALENFAKQLQSQKPPQAAISSYQILDIPVAGDGGFVILSSDHSGAAATLISPDLATCPECLAELFDPADRRYLYPFINCTNCGPRYTIISDIPYDRSSTTMSGFAMCAHCRHEYDDPSDRRFHAQPNACPECGPVVSLLDGKGHWIADGSDAISSLCAMLRAGKSVAVKGLGGFHLAVDAANDEAVHTLRRRKGREEKPLAVMFTDLLQAKQAAILPNQLASLLQSPAAPIVLARKRGGCRLSPNVAPRTGLLGIMLPYTPVHHLILKQFKKAVVMTSGNLSEEPICIKNEEAVARLSGIADGFLVHNRDILIRSDDSVLMEGSGAPLFFRRSRGFCPNPIGLAESGPQVLATGGELKNTVCLLKEDNAFVGQHHGDLENLEAYTFFQETIGHLGHIFEIRPELVVHDLHPGYLSTRWATEEQDLPLLGVQHHHAHLASCLAENREPGPAIGIILDGTGYGTDKTIWGGEILVGDFSGFERKCSLEPMLLPGGDAAIKAPWRTALSYLHAAYDGTIPEANRFFGPDVKPVLEMIENKVNCLVCTSCGRLFDAVAAISGGRQTIGYEGQAAIELMEQARGEGNTTYPWVIEEKNDLFRISVRSLIRQVAEDAASGADQADISSRFHRTLAQALAEAAVLVRSQCGLNKVVCSGGVFNNYLLTQILTDLLAQKGFEVLTHSQLPPGDGCLSLGQALIGRQHLV